MSLLLEGDHSPDKFMFKSFDIHSHVFHQNNLKDYFMISSGTNQFSMPSIWKESIQKELQSDFLYRWYTSSDGFQCITSAVKVYEDMVSSLEHNAFVHSNRRVCMTTGGSGAASLLFDYLKSVYHNCRIVLVGLNYSLYERLAYKHRFSCVELCNENSTLPKAGDFYLNTSEKIKNVFVFSLPNNPTGKSYNKAEFSDIISQIKEIDGFVILDRVCDVVFSGKPHPSLQEVITQQNFWNSCAIVNSFSKSDAVAGLRIGYIYGCDELIRFCSDINANSIMNPPTFPAFPVVITSLFRCLYFNNCFEGDLKSADKMIRLFHHLFFVTSAVVPSEMFDYAESVFGNALNYYREYADAQLNNERIMKSNYQKTVEVFEPYIQNVSDMEYGFNFCMWFNKDFKLNELELIEALIRNTGVAILTESSFTLNKANPINYMIRFSTACDEQLYSKALDRMKSFMEREVFIR